MNSTRPTNLANNNTFIGGVAGFNNNTEHDNTFIDYFAGFNNGLKTRITLQISTPLLVVSQHCSQQPDQVSRQG